MYVGNMVLGEGHRGPSSRALHRSLGHRPIEKKSILFHQEGNVQPSFSIMAKVKILKIINGKKRSFMFVHKCHTFIAKCMPLLHFVKQKRPFFTAFIRNSNF